MADFPTSLRFLNGCLDRAREFISKALNKRDDKKLTLEFLIREAFGP